MATWAKGKDWDVFETDSDDGEVQIQMVDDGPGPLRDDEQAIRHVIAKAKRGNAEALEALWWVIDHDGLVNRVLWAEHFPKMGTDFPERL